MRSAKTHACAQVCAAIAALSNMIREHAVAIRCRLVAALAVVDPFAAPTRPPAYFKAPSAVLRREVVWVGLFRSWRYALRRHRDAGSEGAKARCLGHDRAHPSHCSQQHGDGVTTRQPGRLCRWHRRFGSKTCQAFVVQTPRRNPRNGTATPRGSSRYRPGGGHTAWSRPFRIAGHDKF
jgi:hypothetical protein